MIHRDVKPGNIMRMGDGSVKVGLRHRPLADQTITRTWTGSASPLNTGMRRGRTNWA